MRIRETVEENSYDPQGAVWEHYRVSTGAISSRSKWPQGRLKVKRIEDVKTPGFHALLKCGETLPLNPVVIRTTDFSVRPFQATWIQRPGVYGVRGGYSAYGTLPSNAPNGNWWDEHVPNVSESLLNAVKLAAASNAVDNKWDVLTLLAELRSTVESLAILGRHFNIQVIDVLKGIKKVRRRPEALVQFLNNEWLWLRYGIRPIVYDIFSGVKAMENIFADLKMAIGRGYQEEEVLYANSWLDPPDPTTSPDGQSSITQMVKVKRTYRGWAAIDISGPMDNINLDPLLTAYELLPYSFVVDRFVNIGSWISTLLPMLKGEFAGQCSSIKTEVEATTTLKILPTSNTLSFSYSQDGLARFTKTEYVRYPGSGIPPLPGFNPRVDLPFAVDLVTLFVTGRRDVQKFISQR